MQCVDEKYANEVNLILNSFQFRMMEGWIRMESWKLELGREKLGNGLVEGNGIRTRAGQRQDTELTGNSSHSWGIPRLAFTAEVHRAGALIQVRLLHPIWRS